MENEAGRTEFTEAVDKDVLSPEARASYIYALMQEKFPDLTIWDLVCFSANFLGYVAKHEAPWLELPAKHICRLVYTAHYQDGGTNIDTGIKRNGTGDSSLVDDNKGSESESSSRSIGFAQESNKLE